MNIEGTVGIITVLGTLLAVVVTVLTAITAARTSAFTQMKEVVDRLDKDLTEAKATIKEQTQTMSHLQKELERLRRLVRGYEDYIRALIRQLELASITPVKMTDYLAEEEETKGE